MRSYLLMALLGLMPGEAEVRASELPAPAAERPPAQRDRERAQLALESARNSVAQADPHSPGHDEALAKLKEAEAHFQNARYEEAAQKADDAWKRIAADRSTPTRLSVTVNDKGDTLVKAVSGRVSVEANGATRVIEDGASVQVDKGQAPRLVLGVPRPLVPGDKQRLSVKTLKTGMEPVVLSWRPVEGAESYEVELVPAQGEHRVMAAARPELPVALGAGVYRWSVRALTREARSEASAEQEFEVAPAPVKPLRVKSKWK